MAGLELAQLGYRRDGDWRPIWSSVSDNFSDIAIQFAATNAVLMKFFPIHTVDLLLPDREQLERHWRVKGGRTEAAILEVVENDRVLLRQFCVAEEMSLPNLIPS